MEAQISHFCQKHLPIRANGPNAKVYLPLLGRQDAAIAFCHLSE